VSGSVTSTGSLGYLNVDGQAVIKGMANSNLVNVSSSISTRLSTEETNVDNLQTDSGSFSTRVTSNETNISSNRSLITGITSSLSTTGRMVFVGAAGILTSEAGFEYNATTNQLSVDNLNVNHLTSSFITSSRIFTSGSNIFGDATSDTQTLIGTTKISGSAQITGTIDTTGAATFGGITLTDNNYDANGSGKYRIDGSSVIQNSGTTLKIAGNNYWAKITYGNEDTDQHSFTGNITASSYTVSASAFIGSGAGLTNIPATGIVGLNLSQIASGSATASISPNSGLVVNTNVSSSATSTASFGTYLGDGSQLDGVQAFPFSGSAVITGSLTVSQSIVDFSNASSVVLPAATQPLINPQVKYFTTTVITGSGTTVPIPDGLTFISSSIYEYLEIFINGLRLRYDIDFIPMSTASVQYNFALPVGSEITYKSLKKP
jgi:hypothetical protein